MLFNGLTLAKNTNKALQICINELKFDTMNIDRMEFLAWMERIMNRFDIIGERFENAQKQKGAIDGEELLDNQDLFMMLKVSPRSLQRYRSSGKLPYYTISGKLYYKLSDVNQFIRESFSTTTPKQIRAPSDK